MKYFLLVLSTLFVFPLLAQNKAQVIDLSIRKDYPVTEDNQLMRIEFILLTAEDLRNFTYNLNQETSIFTKVTDDTGFDLLAAQKAYEKSRTDQGYSYNDSKMVYSSPANGGISIRFNMGVCPKAGAKTLTIKGKVGLVMLSDDENSYELKGVPTKYYYGQPGFKTEMGEIKILESGSVGYDDVDYTKYFIESENPVISVEVEGGDDSQELRDRGYGVSPAEIVFKEIPQTLDLKLTAAGTTILEIPFEMELSIGL